MILAFSGGGSRAAALSYGVLEKLRDTRIRVDGRHRRLIDEVDFIYSTSGGSFTAAYFGLVGERIFEDYEQRFLRRDVQAGLIDRMVAPWRWPRLLTAGYNRSEVAAGYYDDLLFDGATFADLQRSSGPFIYISATNIAGGSPFGFDQRQFNLICQDVSGFPLSRAVAASAAVPLVLSPISLRNHASRCGAGLQPWAQAALDEGDPRSRAHYLAQADIGYLDEARNLWLHLVDGGLTDNLGVRPLLNLISRSGGAWEAMKQLGHGDVKRVLFIVVNAQTPVLNDIAQQPSVPITFGLGASVTTTLNAFSFETMSLLHSLMNTWDEQITLERCWSLARRGLDQAGCFDIQHYIVHVTFDAVTDIEQRDRLKRIPTAFRLSDEALDELREVAGQLLDQAPEFQRFVQELGPG